MKTISATNLRVQLRDLLADLDAGPVTITKHGKVVAVLSAPVEPVEAIEATPTTEYIPKALAPPQSPPEPTLGITPVSDDLFEEIYNSSLKDEEETDELDDFEQRVEDLDADFEAYLSKQTPMDRPMP
tara:strand:+ start:1933 stop:2316 length:384 start_codon:yes stop_codon:yes gene_type:complete